jgi:hypothetical protein
MPRSAAVEPVNLHLLLELLAHAIVPYHVCKHVADGWAQFEAMA